MGADLLKGDLDLPAFDEPGKNVMGMRIDRITQLTGSTSCCRGTGDHFKGALIRPLDLVAISHVFTIDYVAKMLGEDVEWLRELQIDMEAEDDCLRVHGVGEGNVQASDYGIEYLKETIAYQITTRSNAFLARSGGEPASSARSRMGKSALNLCRGRAAHIAGTAWSTKRYLNIELQKDQQMTGAITALYWG